MGQSPTPKEAVEAHANKTIPTDRLHDVRNVGQMSNAHNPGCEEDTRYSGAKPSDAPQMPAADASTQHQSAPTPPLKKRSQLGNMAQGAKRKKRSSLAEMSAAVTAKPVKLNTLEKSKLDWEAYKGTRKSDISDTMTEAEREELDAQTCGGGSGLGSIKGYMHRKEFLDRVHDRLEMQEAEARFGSSGTQ